LKESRYKGHITYRGTIISMIDFSSEKIEARRYWNETQAAKRKK